MAQAYLGEIRMFAGAYAPEGWLECAGQVMPTSEYDELFTLIGTTYGGDGFQTFKLPDLRGRAPLHMGRGNGMTEDYPLGSQGGAEAVPLTTDQLPVHKHALMASKGPGSSRNPEGNVIGSPPAVKLLKDREEPEQKLAPSMVAPAGESRPHENRIPYLALTFIICIDGDHPHPG